MENFKIGDWVYVDDWLYGQIIELEDDGAQIGFDTAGGGGCIFVAYGFLRKAEGA